MDAVTVGTEMGQRAPMVEPVGKRGDRDPAEWLVDGGYPAHEQLDQVAERTQVYALVPTPKDPEVDPHAATPKDSDAVGAWRERMGTEDAKVIDKDRAATAECVNAIARERGLTRRWGRGTANVRCVLLLHALAHNLMRTVALAPDLLGYGEGTSGDIAVAT